jgi:hypothetical protein
MVGRILALLVTAVLSGGPEEPPRYRFPPVAELPDREGMPDPFVMYDGSRVATRKDWLRQRRPQQRIGNGRATSWSIVPHQEGSLSSA